MPEQFADPRAITSDVADIIRPPRRISVSDCARDVVKIETPGGYSGPWDPALTPYMVEPMDLLKSRRHEAVIFVSPARAGKTQGLLDGWLAHCITADPGDMGLYFSTQTLAYDYRKRRIERLHRNSPRIAEKISPRSHDTTIEMITYRNGMIVNLGWPTSSQLAQRDLRYVAMSDYDSFPSDIGGEGSGFDLAKKRVQVAMSAGMALAESSPKREVTTNRWSPSGIHEAPPVAGGIIPLYNKGDRRRWYWICLDGCGERFEAPAIPLYDDLPDIQAAAETAHVACPHCGQVYRPTDKKRLNAAARWQVEPGRTSTIASFWLLGCAAAFQRWESIVANYLMALREFDAGGDEAGLRATVNTDQGIPYTPRRLSESHGAGELANRREHGERYTVPDGVRTLLALVDVQAASFQVAVIGIGEGDERWIVDRYAILQTDDGIPCQPPVFLEHWDALVERVIHSTYKLPDGKELRVYRTAIDSGGYHNRKKRGKADSTRRAYDWWRSLAAKRLHHRVILLKGASTLTAPLVKLSYPDSSKRADRHAGSRGDVPVLILNTNKIKDALQNDLARDVPGPGYIHIPGWLDQKHLDEITAEQRTPQGWEKIGNRRNETIDLLCYSVGLWKHITGPRFKWSSPPPWAKAWDSNSEVITADQRRTLKSSARTRRRRPSSNGLAPDDWAL